MGRVDCEATDGPQFGFPGVSVRIKFEGTELRATIDDSGAGTATTTNYLDVVVDGGDPVAFEVTGASTEYVLAEGLSEGEHEVLLWKRTEASVGTMQIQGFRLRGDTLLPAQGPSRRLEFIGDSVTCGYGNEVSTTTPDDFPFTSANENSHLAYGAVTASLLSAEYMGVSYSGRGMSRNYAGGAGETVPQFYLDILPDSGTAPAWDPSRYLPDAVIINVGTNDFSTEGFDTDAYTQAYSEFLASLRGYYPSALFVAAIGPMLTDSYPPGAMSLSNAQQGIQDAIAAREAEGDANIVFVNFPAQSSPYGEDWHPTVGTHASMAEQLAEVLRGELGW
jgi:lysophospholipase L1-like esterase